MTIGFISPTSWNVLNGSRKIHLWDRKASGILACITMPSSEPPSGIHPAAIKRDQINSTRYPLATKRWPEKPLGTRVPRGRYRIDLEHSRKAIARSQVSCRPNAEDRRPIAMSRLPAMPLLVITEPSAALAHAERANNRQLRPIC